MDNLELRITLKRLSSAPKVRRAPNTYKAWSLMKKQSALEEEEYGGEYDDEYEAEYEDDRPRPRTGGGLERGVEAKQNREGGGDVTISKTFTLQEKLYSAREILQYSHRKRPSKNTLDEQYHREVREILGGGHDMDDSQLEAASRRFCVQQKGAMLCTKVDDDGFVDPEELSLQVTTSASEELNPLASKIVQLPRHKQGKTHHSRDINFQSFYINALVDLPTNEDEIKVFRSASSAGYEKVLCHLRVFHNGSFEMKPPLYKDKDRNKDSDSEESDEDDDHMKAEEWYFFTSPQGIVYAYRIECTSLDDGTFFAAREKDIKEELRARELDLQRNRVSAQFEKAPPEAFFRMNIFGEISKAYGFDHDNLYVEYEVHLGDGWVWTPRGHILRSSCTQLSKGTIADTDTEHYAKETRVNNFAFPIELELLGSTSKCFVCSF